MQLKIMPVPKEDVYKDIVRIPEQYRLDARGNVIPEGNICKVAVGGKSAYAILRGCGDEIEPIICVDERLRNSLGLSRGDDKEFRLTPVGFWGQYCWAWNASDPAYRVVARLSLLSVILGGLGLALGLLSFRGCP